MERTSRLNVGASRVAAAALESRTSAIVASVSEIVMPLQLSAAIFRPIGPLPASSQDNLRVSMLPWHFQWHEAVVAVVPLFSPPELEIGCGHAYLLVHQSV